MAIKHVVFDWDGTLANTYPVISDAYAHVFKVLGVKPVPYDEIIRLTSTLQNKDTLEYIFGNKKEDAKEIYYDYISKNHVSSLEAMPNAEKLLNFCMERVIKCYLITNKKRKFFEEESKKTGLKKFFTNTVTAGDYSEDKPNPIATKAVFLDKKPPADEILVVGDGVADYKVARTYDDENIKTKCVIYDPYGKYKGEEPDFKVDDLACVINIISKL